MVGGVPVTVMTIVNPANTGLLLAGTDWDLSLAPRGTDGRPAPLGTDGGLVLAPSGTLPLAASGYAANSSVFVYLMSTPVLLGVLEVDASGAMSGKLELPRNLVPGAHTLQVNGYSASGLLRSVSLGVTVSPSVLLPRTLRTRVVFDYSSHELSTRSKLALRAVVGQVRALEHTSGLRDSSVEPAWRTTITGAVRAEGATASDRLLAMRRAQAVAAYLRSRGLVSDIRTITRPTPVSNQRRDRFVEVVMVTPDS